MPEVATGTGLNKADLTNITRLEIGHTHRIIVLKGEKFYTMYEMQCVQGNASPYTRQHWSHSRCLLRNRQYY
jgi:hypothetical protein